MKIKFHKRILYIALLLLLALNIILRYPCTPHELGTDSFYIHALGNSISEHGYAQWILHLSSFFGLYPFSYPSGVPFFISGLSQFTGLDMELTILVVATFFGILSVFTSYLMAGAILDDDRFKFLVAFGYSLSPFILKFTIWSISTRGLFLILLPLLIWSFFKWRDSNGIIKWKYHILSIILLIVLAAVHRMFWIALIFYFSFLLFIILYNISEKILIHKKCKYVMTPISIMSFLFTLTIFLLILAAIQIPMLTFLSKNALWNLLVSNKKIIFLALLLSGLTAIFSLIFGEEKFVRRFSSFNLMLLLPTMFLIQFTSLAPWRDFQKLRYSAFAFLLPFSGTSTQSIILNLTVMLGARLGIFLLVGVIGLFYIILEGKLDYKKAYLVIISIAFLPFLHIAAYFHESLGFVFYVFAGFLLVALFDNLNLPSKKLINIKKLVPIIVVVSVLSASIAFSGYTLIHRYNNIGVHGERNYMTDMTENAGFFVESYAKDVKISGVEGYRVLAVSGYEQTIINKSNIYIVPNKPPDPITDFGGWFGYLRHPVVGIITSEEEKDLLRFGFGHPPYWHDIIYRNGEDNIRYLRRG